MNNLGHLGGNTLSSYRYLTIESEAAPLIRHRAKCVNKLPLRCVERRLGRGAQPELGRLETVDRKTGEGN